MIGAVGVLLVVLQSKRDIVIGAVGVLLVVLHSKTEAA